MKKITDFPYITSRANPKITEAAKLADKKYRDAGGIFAFEGIKLLSDACRSGYIPEAVYITEHAYGHFGGELDALGIDSVITVVSEAVYEKLSFENAPQGVFSVARQKRGKSTAGDEGFVLFLDNVGDPGNLGAIIRSADAFGVSKIYISAGSADLYSPKTLRACMGSAFRVNAETECDIVEKICTLRAGGKRIYAAMLDESAAKLGDIPDMAHAAFVIGNEGHGVSPAVRAACERAVYIPMREGGAQSLNAAVAASIIIWEACGGNIGKAPR